MTENSKKLEAMCVACLKDRDYLNRALTTWRRCLPSDCGISLVVPSSEAQEFQHQFGSLVRVVPEDEIDKRLAALPPGWYQQQLVKLCLHLVSTAEALLVFDADVFMTRPVEIEDFFVNERLKFYVESRTEQLHPDWLVAAEHFLGWKSALRHSYFVTPNLMHREVLTSMHEYLTERYKLDGIQVLINSLGHFTEWASYGLYAEEIHTRYMEREVRHEFTCDLSIRGIWNRKNYTSLCKQAGPLKETFVVVQSSLGVPVETLVSDFGHLFDLT